MTTSSASSRESRSSRPRGGWPCPHGRPSADTYPRRSGYQRINAGSANAVHSDGGEVVHCGEAEAEKARDLLKEYHAAADEQVRGDKQLASSRSARCAARQRTEPSLRSLVRASGHRQRPGRFGSMCTVRSDTGTCGRIRTVARPRPLKSMSASSKRTFRVGRPGLGALPESGLGQDPQICRTRLAVESEGRYQARVC